MKTPNLTIYAAALLMDLVERLPVDLSDKESIGILRARGLIDVNLDASTRLTVTSLGDRIAEALYALWTHANRGEPENGISRALRGLVAEVVGAVPGEPPPKTTSEPPPAKAKRRPQR